jgi:murein DD-endopeptidase MepM/ murein hydrolase activator NlpD
MSRLTFSFKVPKVFRDLTEFAVFLRKYSRSRGYQQFSKFEKGKTVLVDLLYKKRGRYARPFLHFGTVGLIFLVVTFGPLIFAAGDVNEVDESAQGLLAAAEAFSTDFYTVQAEEVRQYRGGEIITHSVADGETFSTIAAQYGIQSPTIYWENELTDTSKLKPGQSLKILPVNGVRHKVTRGETVFTIAKKYGLDESQAQVIVDYPFNEFLNDETFELTTGQQLMIPDGVKPQPKGVKRFTFDAPAGAVAVVTGAGSGQFLWPVAGHIGRVTQGYRFYHQAFDIANRAGGSIIAADAGTVVVAGYIDNGGYGNRVIVDHGNGFRTLYAHLSVNQVNPGDQVSRGQVLGQMGNTGRSTGTHLHFEISQGGVKHNPGSFIR